MQQSFLQELVIPFYLQQVVLAVDLVELVAVVVNLFVKIMRP